MSGLIGDGFVAALDKADLSRRIAEALNLAESFGQIDGAARHATWVIDQMVRALLGGEYDAWVEAYEERDENGEAAYMWDEGIAP